MTWQCPRGGGGIAGSAVCRDGQWFPQPECENNGIIYHLRMLNDFKVNPHRASSIASSVSGK